MMKENLDSLIIRLASPEEIKKSCWAEQVLGKGMGEVKKPETINYRTLKPESRGLFCERIFGPVKDWECHCGKYRKIKYKGIICDRCGVQVTRSKVRRERMGYIELAAPVCHIWYLKGTPSPISLLLDISTPHLEKIIYFSSYVIIKADKSKINKNLEEIRRAVEAEIAEMENNLKKLKEAAEREIAARIESLKESSPEELEEIQREERERVRAEERTAQEKVKELKDSLKLLEGLEEKLLINEFEYRNLQRLAETLSRRLGAGFENLFKAGTGAEAVRELLKKIDLDRLSKDLRKEIKESRGPKRAKAIKRLEIVEAFRKSGNRPEWMILEVLPVIPPELRPLVQLDGGRFASSDLNDLYRRVINRNNRLRKISEIRAPECIINYERRLLQEAVDALIDNSRRRRPVLGSNNRPLRSLSDVLKGKEGRFRRNLLGKRVDYSGRSVIIVGPRLKLHQCGLPKEMAIELFKPFVMHKLVEEGHTQNIKTAKKIIETGRPEAWKALEEVVKNYPVLLNRAPTLHRVGIQAFEPVLIDGKAIQIHPLVCPPFGADFDGDQIAVHVPLTAPSIAEAYVLMMSTNNIFSPAHGEPLVTPTQDMVLGCYYLTQKRVGAKGSGKIFASASEAILAYEKGLLDLHADIRVGKLKVTWRNRKENLATRISDFQTYSQVYEFLHRLEPLQQLAKERAQVDTPIEEDAERIIEELEKLKAQSPKDSLRLLEELQKDLTCIARGTYFVTTVGRVIFNQILPEPLQFIDKEIDKKELSRIISEGNKKCGLERVIQFLDDVKELGFKFATRAGISIALTDMDIGEEYNKRKMEILAETEKRVRDIDSKYRRGLITRGEREGEITRAWVEATEEVADAILKNIDPFNPIYMMTNSGARGTRAQLSQLSGMRGLMVDPHGRLVEDLPVRSNFRDGLSVLEYFISTHGGRRGLADTALRTADAGYLTRKLVDVAQDVIIREEDCGTSDGIEVSAILEGDEVVEPLSQRIKGRIAAAPIVDPETENILVEANEEITDELADLIERIGIEKVKIRSPLTCQLPHGICALCYGRDLSTGRLVEVGEAVGIIAAQSIGEPGTQMTLRTFHIGGVASSYITGVADVKKKEQEAMRELYADMSSGFIKADLQRISERERKELRHTLIERIKGLLRVVELFEARDHPKGKAIITKLDGRVAGIETKDLRKVVIVSDPLPLSEIDRSLGEATLAEDIIDPETGEVIAQQGENVDEKLKDKLAQAGIDKIRVKKSYIVPYRGELQVAPDMPVKRGDRLTDGPLSPQEVLSMRGWKEVQDYLVRSIQAAYRSHGVIINDKHLEIIVRQMLRKVKVRDPGDTDFLPGQIVDRFEFEAENRRIQEQKGEPAKGDRLLLGITDAALTSDSWLSSASFQKTTKVLAEAAIKGKEDKLLGLKENVIIGRLIPAGTGLAKHKAIEAVANQELMSEEELLSEVLQTEAAEAQEPSEGDQIQTTQAEGVTQ